MSGTARFALPLLAPGQAQKELYHNEAVQLLDLAIAAAVEELPRASPPDSPAVGDCYIVAAGASGAWAGRENCLAGYTDGGWRFVAAKDGLSALVRATSLIATFRSGAWSIGELRGEQVIIGENQVVGARQPAIANPAGGANIDSEARAAITALLAAARQHGLIASS